MLALDDLLEPADRVLELHVLAGSAGELLRDEVRLREEALDAARAPDDELVLVGQLVHPEDRDDVLQVLVALEDLLERRRRLIVLVRDDAGLEGARERVERVDGRVDPLLDDRSGQRDERVQMRERVRRCGVGEVVRRHVDRLHRGHRARSRRGDPLLELAHLAREGGLVADGARHAAEEGRHLRPRLDEAEDVVDEQEHVLALVAEVLGHRERGEADAKPRSRRLVHLPEDERDLVEDAGLLHLAPEVVALARALADAGEDGDTAVLLRDVVDQLLDEDGLAETRASEEPDLPALHEWRDQVDDLEARLEDLHLGREVPEGRGVAMDRPPLDVVGDRPRLVDRVARHVPEAAERRCPDGHRDGIAGVDADGSAREPVGRVHGDGADSVVAQMLLHLRDQRASGTVGDRDVDAKGVVDRREAGR